MYKYIIKIKKHFVKCMLKHLIKGNRCGNLFFNLLISTRGSFHLYCPNLGIEIGSDTKIANAKRYIDKMGM
jgi:hypothetical protein